MPKKKPGTDPYADRETARYENPIASREHILQTLETIETPCTLKTLLTALSANEDEVEAYRKRLKAMRREGQISENKKGLIYIPDKSEFIAGKIVAHRDGFGFLIRDDKGNDDIYLNNQEMRKVFDGDEVLGRIINDKGGKYEGEIVEVTTRHTTKVVGKLFKEPNRTRVVANNPKIQHSIFVDTSEGLQAEHEQIVVVEITRQPDIRQAPKGIIKEVLGNALDPGMEIDIAIRSFDIPFEWPKEVLQEIEPLSDEPTEEDKHFRVDLRDKSLVTIDGEDARDFDDAVYCEKKKGGGWRLWVAIADVSHYVKIGSALDEEAHLRGTSVYFPEHVVPMLPEKISNGLCSLKPGVDRLCMVCEMTISDKGQLSGYTFYEAVMHSHARLTYNEVGKIIQEKDDPSSLIRESYKDLTGLIDELHNLFTTLKKQRHSRGAIEFETVETRVIFDENRKIEQIVPVVRNDAHKLIEECMLCANVATARFLEKSGLPALYRIHEGPNEKKLGSLRAFISQLGLELSGGDTPTPKDYQALFDQIQDRPDAHVIQAMMLRSMSQAAYEPDNRGHFGLAYPAYTHFTSPIRRYPDLLVHRAIRHIIRSDIENTSVQRVEGQTPLKKKDIYPYDHAMMLVLGEQTSMCERRADDATRDVMSWLKCEYLQEHIGDSFNGTIVSVANFGFFVELNELFAEGMVHVSELGNDFYHFDAQTQRLVGEKFRQVYAIGDLVEVVIQRVELDDRKVHLGLKSSKSLRKKGAPNKPPSKTSAKARKKSPKNGKSGTSKHQKSTRKSGKKKRK